MNSSEDLTCTYTLSGQDSSTYHTVLRLVNKNSICLCIQRMRCWTLRVSQTKQYFHMECNCQWGCATWSSLSSHRVRIGGHWLPHNTHHSLSPLRSLGLATGRCWDPWTSQKSHPFHLSVLDEAQCSKQML